MSGIQKILKVGFVEQVDGVVVCGLGIGRLLVHPGHLEAILDTSSDGGFWPYTVSMIRGKGGKPIINHDGLIWCECQLQNDLRFPL